MIHCAISSLSTIAPRGLIASRSNPSPTRVNSDSSADRSLAPDSLCVSSGLCSCGRRRFIEAAVATPSLFPIRPSTASAASKLTSEDYTAMLEEVHPPRPGWYEELYASVLNTAMKSYEAEGLLLDGEHFYPGLTENVLGSHKRFLEKHMLLEKYFNFSIAGYKTELFAELKGKAEQVLEIGIGTGPNLRYYAADSGVRVFGVDPIMKMEKYARAAAVAAGLPLSNFEFIHAVGEAIPLEDASVDAVVGTLVLCSVKDVDNTLKEIKRVLRPGGLYLFVEHVAAKDGTILRFIQSVLDPLQQILSDGCHLTRETGRSISNSGFAAVNLHTTTLSSASFVNPQVYGIARK